MIADSREWLAALLDSPIIRFGEQRGRVCQDCGRTLFVGASYAKYCGDCSATRQRAHYSAQYQNRKAKSPAASRKLAPRPCIEPGCSELVAPPRKRCVAHGLACRRARTREAVRQWKLRKQRVAA